MMLLKSYCSWILRGLVVAAWFGACIAHGEIGLRIVNGDFRAATSTGDTYIAAQFSGGLVRSGDGALSFSVAEGVEEEILGLGAAGSTVIGVGRNGAIFRSSNSGQSFQKLETPVIFGDLRSVTHNGQSRWVAVGTAAGDAITYVSTNDGVSWQSAPLSSMDELHGVAWLSGISRFLAVGENAFFQGGAMLSADGITWEPVTLPENTPALLFVASDSAGNALVGGRDGILLRSGSAELNLTPVDGQDLSEALTTAVAVAANSWWVGGDEGLILRIPPGSGAQWLAEPNPGANAVLALNQIGDVVLVAGQFSNYPWENMQVEFEPLPSGEYRLRLLNARVLHQYRVEFSSNLQSWSTIEGSVKVADGSVVEWVLTPPGSGTLRFYRVRLN